MFKYIITVLIFLMPACSNPPNTPSWPMPMFAGSESSKKAQPVYGRTIYEDEEITVTEVLGIEWGGDKPPHLTLKNDID